MPRARTDGRMLVRSGFFATPRMLAGDTESCDSSICLSSMFLSPLPFQTTAAPAERGERRERPERSAMKAGRTVGRNAMEDPAGVAPCRAGLKGERRPPRNEIGRAHD